MKRTILISIQPRYVEQIFSGQKKFEYRRQIFTKPVNKMIIYETSPTSKVVGEVSILGVLQGAVADIWMETRLFGGIDKESYFQYFKGKDTAYAIQLGQVVKYHPVKSLQEYGVLHAPQSFVYLE